MFCSSPVRSGVVVVLKNTGSRACALVCRASVSSVSQSLSGTSCQKMDGIRSRPEKSFSA